MSHYSSGILKCIQTQNLDESHCIKNKCGMELLKNIHNREASIHAKYIHKSSFMLLSHFQIPINNEHIDI